MDPSVVANDRRKVLFLSGLVLFVLASACAQTATPLPTQPPIPAATTSPLPPPTAIPTPFSTRPPISTPTPALLDLYLAVDDVDLYPVPVLYSGDLITFDVNPQNLGEINPYDLLVRIFRQTPDGAEMIAEGAVGYPTFDGVPRARLVWAWDTSGLEGEQTITVWLDPDDAVKEGDENPDNNTVTLTVRLRAEAERPAVETNASWTTVATSCCTIHYLTGTTGERDLSAFSVLAAEAVNDVQEQLGAQLTEPFDIYLIDRVIGHGGYARQGFTLSYLDRHYAGFDMETVIRHEATHVLDSEMLTEWAPALAREGLAVYVAGGHFKVEPIPERAAALLVLDWYIPLAELADDFYHHQHEIGYLEAAAFVTYLLETHGLGGFRGFYSSFDSSYDTAAEILDAALSENFGMGLEETEKAFLAWLEAHPPTPDHVRDVEITVRLFNAIRRYQALYDPSAYFMIGWLPDPVVAEEHGIVADFLRHPRDVENVALETMLIAAQDAIRAGLFDQAETVLAAAEQVLDEESFFNPLAADYLRVVQATSAAGYEAQQIALAGDTARVWAIADWPELVELTLGRTETGWVLGD